MSNYCSNPKHLKKFVKVKCPTCGKGKILKEVQANSYGCKNCWKNCDNRINPLKNGNWCNCKCKHNTLTCRTCFKPIRKINGVLYFVKDKLNEKESN